MSSELKTGFYKCNVKGCEPPSCVHKWSEHVCPYCGRQMVYVTSTGFLFCSAHQIDCEYGVTLEEFLKLEKPVKDPKFIELDDESLLMVFDTHYSVLRQDGFSFDIKSDAELFANIIRTANDSGVVTEHYMVTFKSCSFNTGSIKVSTKVELQRVAEFLGIQVKDCGL